MHNGGRAERVSLDAFFMLFLLSLNCLLLSLVQVVFLEANMFVGTCAATFSIRLAPSHSCVRTHG